MHRNRKAIAIVVTTLVCIGLFVVLHVSESDEVNDYNSQELKPTGLLGCELRQMDPWDPQILPYNDPNWKPSCKRHQSRITDFVDGKIVLNTTGLSDDFSCKARCLWNGKTKADWEYTQGEWENITTFKASCDIVEVACFTGPKEQLVYNFLHTQIAERPDDAHYGTHSENATDVPGRKPSNQYERPNIYLLVFDSTSTSEFVRSMSRTLYLMKERHQAVIFEHMNKVGLNTRPNAWALMFGKQIYKLGKNPYSDEMSPDLNYTMNCETSIDNEDFWMYRFRDLGYHTMMADDWALGSINWSNCSGFARAPAKHYMKPFQWRTEEKDGEHIRRTIKGMCHETYEDTSLYWDQFMNAYKNQSQMAYMWNNDLAHNYANGLYHADDHFYRLLKRHEERMNNSFVFILGDHGLRFGGIRRTEVGEQEDNNPLLMVSVPVQFRETKLMNVLRENANKLITHYDTYASLIHLAYLNNSFVFILGDHGLRFGKRRATQIGEKEDNNPFLMLTVPVQFRESKLMKVLRQNANKLVTHYDTYASLIHLAYLAETNNLHELFDPESEEFKAGHGSSYFRRRMNEPRDCGALRIPYESCLCEKKFEPPIRPNSTEAIMMADFVIGHFQDMIDNQTMTKKCQKFFIEYENTVAEKLVLPDEREVYRLKVSVLPSKGIFSGYLEVARNDANEISSLSLMSKRFERNYDPYVTVSISPKISELFIMYV
uniref:Sulfatase domain-containing protein n=1 Tax=Steinernema glaseri TaxID=37863 RepID=A0A1I7YJY7_9BILA